MWSDGAWPQMPLCRWLRRAPSTASFSIFSMPGSCSSKESATMALSRSTPSVSWVRSLLPIEKPSNNSLNSSISSTLFGISHIT
jgi:hypothetical protein